MRIIECNSKKDSEIASTHREFVASMVRAVTDADVPGWDFVVFALKSYDGAVSGGPMRVRLPFFYPQTRAELDLPIEHAVGVTPFDDVQLEVPALDTPLEDDADDEIEDPDPEQERAVLERRLAFLRDALDHPKIAEQTKRYAAKSKFGVQWARQPEVFYETDFAPLLGRPLPPPPSPASALGVIIRMRCQMHSASSSSDSSLGWLGDKLVEATLSGAEATDATIALLDNVPDVAEVCASLEVLRLEDTRISNAGRERLARHLPKVKVIA